MIFVDSSAVVALLADEPGAPALAAALEADHERMTAGHVILESSMRLATLLGVAPTVADGLVTRLLREADIAVVPITGEIAHLSVAAFERYGKGRRKPASLNFGDCLSYACARAHDARLLFVGNDFSQTDIPAAQPPP